MPRAPWVRRRRTTDSPRPAGRRWAGRLRRSGSLARQMLLVRVGRRRESGGARRAFGPENGLDGYNTRLVVTAESTPFTLAPISPPVPRGAHAPPRTPRSVPLLPGEHTHRRQVQFALVTACTLASLGLGMSAIFLSMHGAVQIAGACLIGCVIFDGLDGHLARRLGVASPFGAQLDSLADMTSFGIAAPVVVYTATRGSAPTPAVAVACALVGACAAIRLARFNVSPKDGRFFCGVPTTMTAAVLGLATLIGLRLPGVVAVPAIILLALAMVSGFPYAKLARIARLPVWVWVAPVVGALVDYRITFAALVVLYLASGPLLWLHERQY